MSLRTTHRCDVNVQTKLWKSFCETCTCQPQSIALFYHGEQFTRQWLLSSALSIKNILAGAGIEQQEVVAIYLPRCPELIAAVLACIGSNAVFLLIDPFLPLPRVQKMVSLSQPALVLYDSSVCNDPDLSGIMCLDLSVADCISTSKKKPKAVLKYKEKDVLYIIFTSGSIDMPKGIMASAEGTLNRLEWMWKRYPFSEEDILCFKTSVQFVDCIWEILGPTLKGIPVLVTDNCEMADPFVFLSLLHSHKVSRLSLVPSYIAVLLNCRTDVQQKLPALKLCVSSGEPLPICLAERFVSTLPFCSLLNLYGLSEVAADVCYYDLTADKLRGLKQENPLLSSVPIGYPITAVGIKLKPYQDNENDDQSIASELVVTGAAVAHGYIHFDDSNRFEHEVLEKKVYSRSFSTGDLVYSLPSGALVFAGRIDNQLKVGGIRVEVIEVANYLLQNDRVQQAVVTVNKERQQLIAYVQTANNDGCLPEMYNNYLYYLNDQLAEEILSVMKTKVPSYLIPSLLIFTPQLPLLPSGKINKQLLPSPTILINASIESRSFFAATTSTLTQMFARVLGMTEIQPFDSFFKIGGSLMLARKLIRLIQDEFCCNVPFKALLAHQNPSSLANFIFEQLNPKKPMLQASICVTESDRIKSAPLSYQQLGLWLGEQLMPSSAYTIQVAYDAKEEIFPSILFSTIEKLVARHEILRTIFVTDEYGNPKQKVLPWSDELAAFVKSLLVVTDHSSLQWVDKMLHLPPVEFCLSKGPLFRVTLFNAPPNYSSSSAPLSILAIQIHHIIIDGWSLRLLLEEMETIYLTLSNNSVSGLSQTPSYLDYAISQRAYFQQNQVLTECQYWEKQLSDFISQPILPPDKLPPPVLSGNGQMLTRDFKISLSTLKSFCSKFGVTEYVVLLASLQLSLYILGYSQEVTIGTAIADRNSELQKKLIGLLVNMVLIRTKFTRAVNFLSLIKLVKDTFLDAISNTLPIEYIEEKLLPPGKFFMQSLYQVMFVFQHSTEQPLTSSELFKPKPLYHTRCESNIDIYGTLGENILTIDVRYSTDLYLHDTVQHFVEFWENSLGFLLCNPYTSLRSLTKTVSPKSVQPSSHPSLSKLPDSSSTALKVGQERLSWSKLKELATANQKCKLAEIQWPVTCISIAQLLGAYAASSLIVLGVSRNENKSISNGFCCSMLNHFNEAQVLQQSFVNESQNDISAFSAVFSYFTEDHLIRKAGVFLGSHTPLLSLTQSLLYHGISVVVYDKKVIDGNEIVTRLIEDKIQVLICPVDMIATLSTQLVSSVLSSCLLKLLWIHGLPSGLSFLSQWSSMVLPGIRVIITHSLLPAVHHVTHYFNLESCIQELHNPSSYLSIGYASPCLQWALLHIDGRIMPFGSVGIFTTFAEDGTQFQSEVLVRQLTEKGIFQLIAADSDAFFNGEDITPLVTALSKHPAICWSRLSEKRLDYYAITEHGLSVSLYLKKYVTADHIPLNIQKMTTVSLTEELFLDDQITENELASKNISSKSCIVQKIVTEAVCDVLKIDEVQPWHNFRSLGGNSLLVMFLASKLSQEFGINVDVKSVFTAQSVNHLVMEVHQLMSGKQSICCFS